VKSYLNEFYFCFIGRSTTILWI